MTTPTDPLALLRSRAYLRLLVVAAILGVPVVVAYVAVAHIGPRPADHDASAAGAGSEGPLQSAAGHRRAMSDAADSAPLPDLLPHSAEADDTRPPAPGRPQHNTKKRPARQLQKVSAASGCDAL